MAFNLRHKPKMYFSTCLLHIASNLWNNKTTYFFYSENNFFVNIFDNNVFKMLEQNIIIMKENVQ